MSNLNVLLESLKHHQICQTRKMLPDMIAQNQPWFRELGNGIFTGILELQTLCFTRTEVSLGRWESGFFLVHSSQSSKTVNFNYDA